MEWNGGVIIEYPLEFIGAFFFVMDFFRNATRSGCLWNKGWGTSKRRRLLWIQVRVWNRNRQTVGSMQYPPFQPGYVSRHIIDWSNSSKRATSSAIMFLDPFVAASHRSLQRHFGDLLESIWLLWRIFTRDRWS